MVSLGDRNRKVKIIRMQYEQMSEKWGYNVRDLVNRFEKRFKVARENKEDLVVFFKAENEAIAIFEKKLNKESLFEEKRASESIEEKDASQKANPESASDAAPRQASASQSTINRYQTYKSVFIHKLSSEELEYLLGAMRTFYYNANPVLEETRKYIRDKIYRTMSYEVETLLGKLGALASENEIPFIFRAYRDKLEKGAPREEVNKARIEIFRSVVNVIRKFNRLERWINNHQIKFSNQVNILYKDEEHSILVMFDRVLKDLQDIVDDFGLRGFLEME